jgi:Ca2+-binding EF-hand superfamily protein
MQRRRFGTMLALSLGGLLMGMGCATVNVNPPGQEMASDTQSDDGRMPMTSFERWEGEDGEIERDGFHKALVAMEAHRRWDIDGDGTIQADEFSRSVFRLWDTDESNDIDDGEWSAAHRTWYQPGQRHGMFDDWDDDGDGYLSRTETTRGIRRTNLFGHWDDDGSNGLDREEFTDHAFNVWDENDNEYVDQEEWSDHLDAWRQQRLMASAT